MLIKRMGKPTQKNGVYFQYVGFEADIVLTTNQIGNVRRRPVPWFLAPFSTRFAQTPPEPWTGALGTPSCVLSHIVRQFPRKYN